MALSVKAVSNDCSRWFFVGGDPLPRGERGQALADFLKFASRGAEVHWVSPENGMRFSLSPRERAWVRGNVALIHNGYNLT